MGLTNTILPHYTFDDWVHWEGRWELIEGHPIAMSPMPTPQHQRIASEINTELTIALRKANYKKCQVYRPLDYIISTDTILVPDVLIVCGEITRKYLDFPPVLIVEILSPSTALRDRHTKFELYELQGVKYYLLADPENEKIEVFELSNSKYKARGNNLTEFHLESECFIQPDFSRIFH